MTDNTFEPMHVTPAITLQQLPECVLQRIIKHIAIDSNRGTPYYPPKAPFDLLPLAATSRAFRTLVSRTLDNDQPWLHASSVTQFENIKREEQRLLAWYRLAADGLKGLHFQARFTSFPSIRQRIAQVVLAYAPALKIVDVSGISSSDNDYSQFVSSMKQLFANVRSTLVDLRLSLATSNLLDVVCDSNLENISKLEIRINVAVDAAVLIRLLRSLHKSMQDAKPKDDKSYSSLDSLTLRCFQPLPDDLMPEAVKAAAPNLTKLCYFEVSTMAHGDPDLSKKFISIARAYNKLQMVNFHDAKLEMVAVSNFFVADHHPCLNEISFHECSIEAFPESLDVLEALTCSRIRSLHLTKRVGAKQLIDISRHCPNITELTLPLPRDAVQSLHEAVAMMPELVSMSLLISRPTAEASSREHDICEMAIVKALHATGPKFARFMLHGETLSVKCICGVLRKLGAQLRYLVLGIYSPRKSKTKCIMKLLDVIKEHNKELRVLCFGLNLEYDRHAVAMNKDLLEAIDSVRSKLPYLDPDWLRRNAASLKCMSRPQDFQDYDSDDSNTLDDDLGGFL